MANKEQSDLLVRLAKYEARYAGSLRRVLSRQYRATATYIEQNGTDSNWSAVINPNDYYPILISIWTTVGGKEANRSWNEYVRPYLSELPPEQDTIEVKDLFGDIARFMLEGGSSRTATLRGIMEDIFNTYTLPNLQGIAATTRERIETIVRNGLDNGLGAREVARMIRKEAAGDINKNRSIMIARTEVVGASNRGRLLAVMASPLQHSKTWVPTVDARTRISHYYMKDYPAIPVEADFQIANSNGMLESMLCPGDTSRSTHSNYIQCRCSLTFAVLRDENGRVIRK